MAHRLAFVQAKQLEACDAAQDASDTESTSVPSESESDKFQTVVESDLLATPQWLHAKLAAQVAEQPQEQPVTNVRAALRSKGNFVLAEAQAAEATQASQVNEVSSIRRSLRSKGDMLISEVAAPAAQHEVAPSAAVQSLRNKGRRFLSEAGVAPVAPQGPIARREVAPSVRAPPGLEACRPPTAGDVPRPFAPRSPYQVHLDVFGKETAPAALAPSGDFAAVQEAGDVVAMLLAKKQALLADLAEIMGAAAAPPSAGFHAQQPMNKSMPAQLSSAASPQSMRSGFDPTLPMKKRVPQFAYDSLM